MKKQEPAEECKHEIEESIKDIENGDTYSINPNWEEITDELLQKNLWDKLEKPAEECKLEIEDFTEEEKVALNNRPDSLRKKEERINKMLEKLAPDLSKKM